MNIHKKAREDRRKVMEHIRKHGNTPASKLIQMYGCSRSIAYQCLRDAGIEILSMADVRKREGEHKLNGIAAYLVKYGSMSVEDIVKKFNCKENMAIKALDIANMQPAQSKDTGGNSGIDSTMYRPLGRNLLCEAWV